jgi:hypothetical protein
MAKKSRPAKTSANQATRELVRRYLSMAQEIADPAAEAGDHHGSYEVWACTLRFLCGSVRGAAATKAAFRKVLAAAEARKTPEDRVNVIRTLVLSYLEGESATRYVTVGRELALNHIRQYIELAIQIGAPSYNAGDHRGCYEVYACTARLMLRVSGAAPAKARLDYALKECLALDDASDQAWAMRHGFDAVLAGVFDIPLTGVGQAVRDYLISAINIGAPAYDAGDHQGCYDVYACTARMILETVDDAPEAKKVLRAALQECRRENNTSEQAWILRRAFDRLLGVR